MWDNRFGIICDLDGGPNDDVLRGVVGELGDVSTFKLFSMHTSKVFGWGMGPIVVGNTRFGMSTTPTQTIVTFLNADGTDPHVLDDRQAPGVYQIGELSTTGDHFFWTQFAVFGTTERIRSFYSDGVHRGKMLLDPAPGYQDGSVRAADTHIAWQRGHDMQPGEPNKYDHIEMWASRYHGDPTDLAPYKVADLPKSHLVETFAWGGWGHFAVLVPEGPWATLEIWNLEKKTHWNAAMDHDESYRMAGFTKTHLWLTASTPNNTAIASAIFRCPMDAPFVPNK